MKAFLAAMVLLGGAFLTSPVSADFYDGGGGGGPEPEPVSPAEFCYLVGCNPEQECIIVGCIEPPPDVHCYTIAGGDVWCV